MMSGARLRLLIIPAFVLIAAAADTGAGGAAVDNPLQGVHVLWRAAVGGRAGAVAGGGGAVWVATGAPPQGVYGRLLRLDPRTGRRVASVAVGWWPSSVAVGAGGVWVADSIGDGSRLKNHLPGLENAVTRIDPATDRVLATIKLPFVGSLAVAGGAVWATALSRSGELVERIDPRSDRVVARIRLPGASGPLAVGGGRIWALTWFANPSQHARISAIDPASNRVVASVAVPQAGPLSTVVYRRGVLWVSMVNPRAPPAPRGRVVRIDSRTSRQLGRAVLVPGATSLASNETGVWAAGNRWLVGLDGASGAVARRLKLDVDVPLISQSIAVGARTVWLLAGSDVWATTALPTSRVGDRGVLERFAPQSATTWWAIVASNLKPETFIVRTTDAGRHWRDATPPVKLVSSSFFLSTDVAWVEAGTLHSPSTEALYRTRDGGRSWQRLARVPIGCELDFIDQRHGWCAVIGAAAGSSTVRLYRTADGGSTWTLVSRTGLYDAGSTRGALPYGCDKTLTFTSATVGWASSFCNGGSPYLYRSIDGGAHWHALTQVPLAKGAPTPAGEGLYPPVVTGSELAVAVNIAGNPGATAIATSRNNGTNWRTRLVPGRLRQWRADLIDPTHWRFTDGSVLLATDNAGRKWRRWKARVRMTDTVGAPLTLDFLSPRIGFAVPRGNNGPLWRTRNAGTTWQPITITAGPFTLPR